MKYLIKSIESKQTKNQRPYLQFNLINAVNIFARPISHCEFNQTIIDAYKEIIMALPKKEDGKYDFSKLPEEYKYLNNLSLEEIKLPEPMYRLYTSDLTVQTNNGTVVHKAGEKICDKEGNPLLFTSITVLCMEEKDPDTGKVTYSPGWSPNERARQMINAFYIKAKTETNIEEDTPINSDLPVDINPAF